MTTSPPLHLIARLVIILSTLAVLQTLAPARALAATVHATITPSQIQLGQRAKLTIMVEGQHNGPPQPPAIDGLTFDSAGQSSQYQVVNGTVSSSVSYFYLVSARRAGRFTIGPLTVDGNLKSNACQLTVTAATAGKNQSSSSRATNMADIAFLTVTPSHTNIYVGQRVPVTIQAGFRRGLQTRLTSLPEPQGAAFTWLPIDDQPQQENARVQGQIFTILTWKTAFTAVKAGQHPLQARMTATVLLRDQGRQRNRSAFNGFMDDDLFNQFFGRTIEKPLTIVNDAVPITINALPQANQPPQFSGAIGRFSLKTSADATAFNVGEPITLSMSISGQGNFDRVHAPSLLDPAGWRQYDPSQTFEPTDSLGFAGTKRFDQVLIAENDQKQAVPPVVFAYFDPLQKQYHVLQSKPLAVAVTNPAGAGASASAPTPHQIAAAPNTDTPTAIDPLAPNRLHAGAFISSLNPWRGNMLIAGMLALAIALTVAAPLLFWRAGVIAKHPDRLQHKRRARQMHGAEQAMQQAIAGHDIAAFFEACRRAAQIQLGHFWHMPPAAVSLAEIRDRLPQCRGLHQVFESADAAAFSGQRYSPQELAGFQTLLHQELNEIEHHYRT